MNITNWWSSTKTTPDENKSIENKREETYVDLIISLNKNYEIDFSIFLDDKIDKLEISESDYGTICSSFMNAVMSSKMKKDAIEILDTQIKNTNNKKLINNIISLIVLGAEKSTSDKETFIKPSEVFAKYNI